MDRTDRQIHRGKRQKEQKKIKEEYVGAPYNFIPFNKKVHKKDTKTHQSTDLLCGEITYRIETKTPLSVGAKGKEVSRFYKDAQGRYAIPGSTVRGLVRSNAKILSFGSFGKDIEDQKLMYREVASGKDKKLYNGALGNDGGIQDPLLKNVKAGYLKKEGGKFIIIPPVPDGENQEITYHVLSERTIFGYQDDAKKETCQGKQNAYRYILEALQHKDIPFQKVIVEIKGVKKTHYKGEKNENFRPLYKKICYKLDSNGRATGIEEPKEEGNEKEKKEGFLLISGYMEEKKALYIIPKMSDPKDGFEVSKESIEDFKRDFKRREKNENIKTNHKFFNLPEKEGETKPVFYIENSKGKLSLGFTPRLRLPCEHGIMEAVPKVHKKDEEDYCDEIFGYTNKKSALKSKVSFLDALLSGPELPDREMVEKRILSEPKPSSYMDYLEQDQEGAITYNSESPSLRGVKQYWLKDRISGAGEANNEKVFTKFEIIKEGCVFNGKIRFKDLTEDELGLLLYSIQLEEDCEQNMGKGKPYGFGRVKISVERLKLLDEKQAYGLQDFCLEPYRDCTEDIIGFINKFKAEMKKFLGKDLEEENRIKEFFNMKREKNIQKPEDTRYMELSEYKKRKPLPTVSDIVKKGRK